MTGYDEDAITGRSLYEFDIFRHAADREVAKRRLARGETVPQMETEIDLPDEGRKLVIVAGQTIVLRDVPCMLFTFADLEPRRQAERALQHSEERFAGAFQLAPVAMVVASLKDHVLLNTNAAFHAMTGHDDDHVVGHTPSDLTLWDTAATRRRLEDELVKTGRLSNVEARVQTKDRTLLDCLVSASTDLGRREPVRPVGHSGHHRTAEVRDRARRRARCRHAGCDVVQPQRRREAGVPSRAEGGAEGRRRLEPDQSRT